MRWEYKTIKFKKRTFWGLLDEEQMQSKLNSLGAMGWELVSTQREAAGSSMWFFFKKQVG